MTTMLPPTFPETTTASEAAMFRLIRDAENSEEYVCLHSLGISKHRRKDYAEADFVVVAPDGLFCIEVKGGEVRREDGVWWIGWPGKSYTSTEGPFKQAQGARWALMDYLSGRLGKNVRNQSLIGWGVAFPDIVFNERDPEWDPDVVFDLRDKSGSFCEYIKRLSRYFRQRNVDTGRPDAPSLSAHQRKSIVEALRGDFDIVPSLRGLMLESERELVALSADQHRVLDLALNDANARIMVDGGPGTGKSLLAVEAARRLGRIGKRVLFLCFNSNLSEYLRLDLAATDPRIHVSTIHAFLGEIIERGGLKEELRSERSLHTEEEFFEQVYPRLFEDACSRLMEDQELPQYDVLVIDEAQDVLNAGFTNCLDLVLTGGFRSGRWIIFHDSGLQSAVYNRVDPRVVERLRSFGPVTLNLTENFRNPKAVIAEACVATQTDLPQCRRSLISPVDYRLVGNDRDEAKKLRALLLDLLRQGISAERITVLSPMRAHESCAIRFPPDIGKAVCVLDRQSGPPPADAITVASIAGFKGLENDVIILTDMPTAINSDRCRADLYVGMTRARTKVFAMVRQEFLDARANLEG